MLFDYKSISDNESDDNTEENNQHNIPTTDGDDDYMFELNGDVLALELESMTTIVVKTFLRNECLARLLQKE